MSGLMVAVLAIIGALVLRIRGRGDFPASLLDDESGRR